MKSADSSDNAASKTSSAAEGKAKGGFSLSQQLPHMVSGMAGGTISTLILHPLDLIKIRFQVNEGTGVANRPTYNNTLHAIRTIASKQGLAGLYQGVVPNLWGAGLSWGLYFFFYNSVKSLYNKGDAAVTLSHTDHLVCASMAGFGTLVLTNPIWVTKTRLCLQYESVGPSTTPATTTAATATTAPATAASSTHYRGMADAISKIYKHEGIRGWYKGFVPGMFGISHGAVQFVVYEDFKMRLRKYKGIANDGNLNTLEVLSCAATSKMIAAVVTYPYQVIRSRLQDQHRTDLGGVVSVIRDLWKSEGPRGLFKGLSPYIAHALPNLCMVFLIYEWGTQSRIFSSELVEEVDT